RGKANAAAAFRASTLDLENRFNARQLFAGNVAALGSHQFVFGKGGVPLLADGRLLGAVGVSGSVPAENDHVIAPAAAGTPVIPPSHCSPRRRCRAGPPEGSTPCRRSMPRFTPTSAATLAARGPRCCTVRPRSPATTWWQR